MLRTNARRSRQAAIAAARRTPTPTPGKARFADAVNKWEQIVNREYARGQYDRDHSTELMDTEGDAESSGGSSDRTLDSDSPRSSEPSDESGDEPMDFIVPDAGSDTDEPPGDSSDDGSDFEHHDDSSDDGEYNRFVDESSADADDFVNGFRKNGAVPSPLTAYPRDIMEITRETAVSDVPPVYNGTGSRIAQYTGKVGKRLGMGRSRDRDARRWDPPHSRHTGSIGEVFDTAPGGLGHTSGPARQLSGSEALREVPEICDQREQLRGDGHRYSVNQILAKWHNIINPIYY